MRTPDMNEWIPEMSISEWLEYGKRRSWISAVVCYLHDGPPLTTDEETQLETGDEPCINIIRVYDSAEQKAEAEQDYAPNHWREQ